MSKRDNPAKSYRFEMRAPADFLEQLDDWRRNQKAIPSRARAIVLLCQSAIDSDISATEQRLARENDQEIESCH